MVKQPNKLTLKKLEKDIISETRKILVLLKIVAKLAGAKPKS